MYVCPLITKILLKWQPINVSTFFTMILLKTHLVYLYPLHYDIIIEKKTGTYMYALHYDII